MTIQNLLTVALAAVGLVEAAKLPFRTRGESLIGRREYNQLLRRQHTSSKVKLPDWHYANATTQDATSNGMSGVILEADLVLGKPGKDGATVTKCMPSCFIQYQNELTLHSKTRTVYRACRSPY
jgi:hypothetical protein